MGFLSALGGPLKDVFGSVTDIIKEFHTSDEEKLEAQRKLVELERDFQLKAMELDQKWAETQAGVITAEVKSESWMARNWRPILMLTFTYIIAHNYIIGPLFSLKTLEITPDMWALLKLGMGGYIAGRTVEKVTPQVTEIFTKK